MRETSQTAQWVSLPKIRFLGLPLGLGLILVIPGGLMTVLMVMALTPEDHWAVTLGTLFMILGFLFMFLQGMRFLLMPFEKLWICPDELQLRLGGIVLRRIPADQVRSIVPEVRNVLVKNKDSDLYRLKIYPDGKWPHNRLLWIDWSVKAQDTLRETFRDRITLLF